MSNNTKIRSAYLRSIATQIVADAGDLSSVITTDDMLDLRRKLVDQMQAYLVEAGKPASFSACQRHISAALGTAITGVSAELRQHGGARANSGLRPGMKIHRVKKVQP